MVQLLEEAPVISGVDKEAGFGKMGKPGDFADEVQKTIFANSKILALAGKFAEMGDFAQGIRVIEEELAKRGIRLEFQSVYTLGTRRENGQETMVLNSNYPNEHAVKKLWSLMHRNMSLILQRSGKRQNPEALLQLLKIDLAYSKAIRLGATKLEDAKEKEAALKQVDVLELDARLKLSSLKTDMPRKR